MIAAILSTSETATIRPKKTVPGTQGARRMTLPLVGGFPMRLLLVLVSGFAAACVPYVFAPPPRLTHAPAPGSTGEGQVALGMVAGSGYWVPSNDGPFPINGGP